MRRQIRFKLAGDGRGEPARKGWLVEIRDLEAVVESARGLLHTIPMAWMRFENPGENMDEVGPTERKEA